ncbi:rhodanese-like domain-containing protein [Vibrio sp. V33_P6A3T137]|uniref:rhodanese-like domain-containing protein n=1 Tax=Vibrio sp. V33_P6A3T137 TaxID=1938685 RepID=UPI0013732363|nr:rhodanese-like domain-containing protein [Vibrio sp. V33_P6A3T137]NAW79529.1 rhodanese-like domain-containing protein [Vibrio sp. V33_P6A3T137]
MRRYVLRLTRIALLIGVLLSGTAGASPRAEMAWSMIAEGAVLIDVRTEQEFMQGHLDSAQHIPLSEIMNSGLTQFAKDQPIVLYCRTGNRSNIAKQHLIKQGFTHVHDAGGLDEIRQSLPNRN